MERCSRYWGTGEGCFGISFRHTNNSCSIKTSSVSTQTLEADSNYHSALVDRTQTVGQNESCPFSDQSNQSLDDGVGSKVHCGKDLPKFDYCPDSYPSCNPLPFSGFLHAASLQDCVGLCAKQNPPCHGVSFVPSAQSGFANCWPKFDF
jgi:hypothetical protein